MIGCLFLMPGERDGHLYPVSNAFFTAVKANTKAIIGGHISSMETTQEALKREFEEELHAQIEIDHLIAVGEIFFPCATLDYDFSEEKKFSYKNLSMDEIIHHLAVFVSRLWQIHVFGDSDVIIGTRLEKPSKINGFAL
ncbi:MAG: NUDIX domain-containing protein [Lachnospiraceae bacterium]|nr:NUDIX domain-containing protein [Lachnospiraceae bacterium]